MPPTPSNAPLADLTPFDLGALPDGPRSFHEQFLAYGRTAPATVKEAYRRLVADGQVQTLFVDDRRFNAFARSRRGTHLIALNVAVPSLLHFVFNNALRLEYVFREVGSATAEEPYREADDRRPIPLALPDTLPVAEALVTLPGVSRPRDERRALVASALTEVAGAFCVFHEVGHLIGGHTGYASAQLWGGDVAEFTGSRFTFCPRRLLRQSWEREADIIAAVMTMSFVLNDPGTREHFRDCFDLPPEEDEYPYHVFSVVLFAVKLLFLYLAQIPLRFDVRAYHPHPLIRATYVHSALRLTAADDLGLDIEALDPLLDAATDQADQVWSDLGARVPALDRYAGGPELARVVEREIVRLEEAHKRLQPGYSRWSWLDDSVWKERQG
jgi:hypothetical protein